MQECASPPRGIRALRSSENRTHSVRHFPALTGIRFFLALWVVIHHLTGPTQPLGIQALRLPAPIYQFIRDGYLAVQTFFILSGFVLGHGYAGTRWSGANLRQYFLGRFARVYPVYLLGIVVMIPFIIAEWPRGVARYLAAYVFLLTGWLGTLPVNWNTPAWTLSCEAFFYALFPLAVILIRRPQWRAMIPLAAAACAVTPAIVALGIPDSLKPLVHFPDFLMGIVAAGAFELLRKRSVPLSGSWLCLAGLAGIATLIVWPNLPPAALGMNTVLRPLNAILLIGLALGGGIIARLLSANPVVYLGKASYAMYILHVPLYWWCWRKGEFNPVLYVALVIAISALVYSLYEEPINRRLRG